MTERGARRTVTAMTEIVISAQGLAKRYGDVEAVRGVDLEVRRGEIFAFLGPNGAGKTTTVEILEGFRSASAGEVSVLGVDPAHAGPDWRNRVGAVLQESQSEPGLTVRECLQLYAGYYAAPRSITDTIALVGLDEKSETLAEHLSGGQRRRLDVALALIGDPELVFLDDALHGRGGEPRRPDRDHRRRSDRRGGHTADARRSRPARRDDPVHAASGNRRRRPAGAAAAARRAGVERGRRDPHRVAAAPRARPRRLGGRARHRPARPRRSQTDSRRRLPRAHRPRKGKLMFVLIRWLIRRRRARKGTAAAETAPPRGRVGLVLHQARYDLLGMLRNRQARFFTLILPLIFLVIFVSVFGNHTVRATGVKASTYYVPGI